jgi:hypothetical protein
MTLLEVVLLLGLAATVAGTLRFLRSNYPVKRPAE